MLHRRVLSLAALAAALALTSCDDPQQPRPDAQVSDGSAFGGSANPHFFFLPPLVPSPDYSGTFDGTLLPLLSVRITGPFLNDALASCGEPIIRSITQSSGLMVDTDLEQYSYDWKTSTDHLTSGSVYRVCVLLTLPNVPAVELGFRDVRPGLGGGSVSQRPVYQFNNGRTIPIKFRVETGLLSAAYCVDGTADPNDPNSYDCTAQILASNETAYCDNHTCALTTGEIANGASELFIVEKFGLEDAACTAEGVTDWLDIDNPQYAGCVRITVPNGNFTGFETQGTVGACFYEESGPHPLKPGQDEAIQLHIQYPGIGTPPTVWALPWAAAGIEGTCEVAWQEHASASGSVSARVTNYAARAFRTAQRLLNPWFAPPKAYAFHTGFGGHTSLKSTEPAPTTPSLRVDNGPEPVGVQMAGGASASLDADGPQVFLLDWALPSAMAPYALASGEWSVEPGDLLVVSEGDPVSATVRVIDNGATGEGLDRVLGTPRSVLGARVHFSVGDGASTAVFSDADGLATFHWTAARTTTAEGDELRVLTARGFGIGTDDTGGPFDALGAAPAQLGTGQVQFRVCVLPKLDAPPAGAPVARSIGPCL